MSTLARGHATGKGRGREGGPGSRGDSTNAFNQELMRADEWAHFLMTDTPTPASGVHRQDQAMMEQVFAPPLRYTQQDLSHVNRGLRLYKTGAEDGQPFTLKETGRPRRTAAPTFGSIESTFNPTNYQDLRTHAPRSAGELRRMLNPFGAPHKNTVLQSNRHMDDGIFDDDFFNSESSPNVRPPHSSLRSNDHSLYGQRSPSPNVRPSLPSIGDPLYGPGSPETVHDIRMREKREQPHRRRTLPPREEQQISKKPRASQSRPRYKIQVRSFNSSNSASKVEKHRMPISKSRVLSHVTSLHTLSMSSRDGTYTISEDCTKISTRHRLRALEDCDGRKSRDNRRND